MRRAQQPVTGPFARLSWSRAWALLRRNLVRSTLLTILMGALGVGSLGCFLGRSRVLQTPRPAPTTAGPVAVERTTASAQPATIAVQSATAAARPPAEQPTPESTGRPTQPAISGVARTWLPMLLCQSCGGITETAASIVALKPLATGPCQLPLESVGAARSVITPSLGLTLRAGVAQVQIQPYAVPKAATLQMELLPDGRLQLALVPPQDLAAPAWVTLPLPPGAKAGEDPRTWPVALLQSEGQEVLLLSPEAVTARDMTVAVPHFSTLIPAQLGDVIAKVGQVGQELVKTMDAYSPRDLEVQFIPLPNYDRWATTKKVRLVVRARAATSDNGGLPRMTGGKLDPKWYQFNNLAAVIRIGEDEDGEVIRLQNGSADVEITLPGGPSDRAVYRTARVDLVTRGVVLATHCKPLPAFGLWGLAECAKLSPPGQTWLDFRVHYINDPQMVGYPDTTYAEDHNPPRPGIPATVCDVCEALSSAYRAYEGATFFSTTDNSPSLPIDVYLQPWEDSKASNYDLWHALSPNTIYLKVLEQRNWRKQATDAAHELAHLFQQEYSVGLIVVGGGKWFHDASAEYLAQKWFGMSNADAAAHIAEGNPQWLIEGLTSIIDANNYAASSFLGFLASRYNVQVPALWQEGASGISQTQSWIVYISSQLPTGLHKVWREFLSAYLINNSTWGTWEESNAKNAAWSDSILLTSRKLYAERGIKVPGLSGGNVAVGYVGTEAEAVVVYLVRIRQQWITLAPLHTVETTSPDSVLLFVGEGDKADGRGCPLVELSKPAPPSGYRQHIASLKLKPKPSGLGADTLSRLVVGYCQGVGEPLDVTIAVWALPVVQEVAFDPPNLTWKASPLEGIKGRDGQALLKGYEIIGYRKGVSETLASVPAGTTKWQPSPEHLKAPKAVDYFCVCARDAYGFASPEACAFTLEGSFTGFYTPTKAYVDSRGLKDMDIDGDGKVDMTAKQCEDVLKAMLNMPKSLRWEFTPKGKTGGEALLYYEDDSGRLALVKGDNNKTVVFQYTLTGDKVVIESSGPWLGASYTFRFEGRVSLRQGTIRVEGTFSLVITQGGATVMSSSGDWWASR